ncbi:response regulator [Salinivirga cyanobacteriivorans]|uniref:Chemotaxis protein CheY n=1 Tax=Salinivirga cyanobacteriivorans TaxID=1307839 RepID=A0A0S2I4Y5_9BACT|nr:response regulator [Salinivirga cyanobacteriivorans]ALO17310.1 Chemotaxis protein CheY [Salinivirga cyanobacteriivorans]
MKKKVLVVDDFENTRWIVQQILQKEEELEVLSAGNGKEALQHFESTQIDLLVTDLNMPEMDGIELVKAVRAKDRYKFMPIIMLTTERNPEKKQKAMDIKVTTWIQKPFEQSQFRKIIRKALRLK